MTAIFLVLVALIIFLCIFLNNLSLKIGVPTLLAFLGLGMLFGSQGIAPMPEISVAHAEEFCSIALIFIIFYGGFCTRWDSARPVIRESILLASLGVVITAGLTGVFCHYVLHWDWLESLLLGSVLGSTDAASVFSILRSRKLGLRYHTGPMLEVESGSNDPCAYMLTVMMISMLNNTANGAGLAWMLFAQIAFGLAFGFGIAFGALWLLDRFTIKGDGFDSLFMLAVAICSYALPSIVGGNGYLSTYIVGIVLGNNTLRNKKTLINFFDGVTGLMQVAIFFVLGILVKPDVFGDVILPSIAIFFFLLLIARPAAVVMLLAPFKGHPRNQMLMVSFVGLRGASAIVFATMATSGPILSNDIFNIVFCIVLISLLVQGALLPPVAKQLKMVSPRTNALKSFNDYSEEAEMHFSSIILKDGDKWSGKAIKDINLPPSMLVALVIRKKKHIIARGDMVLQSGDEMVLVSKAYEDSNTVLVEKTVKKNGRHDGHAIKETKDSGLVLLVRRGDQNFIPNGDTVLKSGDQLVLLRKDND